MLAFLAAVAQVCARVDECVRVCVCVCVSQVSYYYDPEIGNHYYGHGHPMKPHRVRMAHTLICRYGLYKHLEVS